MNNLTERMKRLLGESNDLVEALDAVASHLEEGGLTLDAESPEAYLAGVQEILETYEMSDVVRKELQELIGTLAAIGLAGAAGKWLHGKYKKWADKRAGNKVYKAHADTLKHYKRAMLKDRTARMQKQMQTGEFEEPVSFAKKPKKHKDPVEPKAKPKASSETGESSKWFTKQAFAKEA